MTWFRRRAPAPEEVVEPDDPLVRFLLSEVRRDSGTDLGGDAKAMGRIEDAAGRARAELNRGAAQTQILLPFLAASAAGPIHLHITLRSIDLARIDGQESPADEAANGP